MSDLNPVVNPDLFDEEDVALDEFLRDTDMQKVETAPGEVGLVVHPETEISEIRAGDGKNKPSCLVTFSTNKLARDGCVLDASGLDVSKYRRNPVVLFAHDYRALPIAKSPNVQYIKGETRSQDKWVGRPEFHLQTDLSREVWWMIQNGYLKAWSIGFIVKKYKRLKANEVGVKQMTDEENKNEVKDARRVWDRFVETEMLEYSSVPVPADPNALTASLRSLREGGRSLPALEASLRAQGFDVPELVSHEIRAEVPEQEHETWKDAVEVDGTLHVPVRDSEEFDTLRVITINQDAGVRAAVGTLNEQDGTQIQAYHFATEKWDEESARAWIDKHGKAIDAARGALRAVGDDPDLNGFVIAEIEDGEHVVMPVRMNEPERRVLDVADILAVLGKNPADK